LNSFPLILKTQDIKFQDVQLVSSFCDLKKLSKKITPVNPNNCVKHSSK
jgi:hypothetical protein